MRLEGLYTALVTPFNEKGMLDKEGLRKNLHFQLENKVQGIVVLGTTGEDPTLTYKEKEEVIEIAAEEIKGKTSFIIGTGTYSTEATIQWTKRAFDMGADAAMIVTPYYNKPTQEGLYRHFSMILEAVPLPICIYNNPSRTGQNLQPETLRRLIHFPTLAAIKEASGNIVQISEMIEIGKNCNPHFTVLSGDDALTLPLIALGGHGIISVGSNLIPDLINQLVREALRGNFQEAQKLHYELLPFFKAEFIETNPIPIKAAMEICGMPSGSCRLPLCEISSDHMIQLKQILEQLPITRNLEYGKTQYTCC